jgi:hypothetical protein
LVGFFPLSNTHFTLNLERKTPATAKWMFEAAAIIWVWFQPMVVLIVVSNGRKYQKVLLHLIMGLIFLVIFLAASLNHPHHFHRTTFGIAHAYPIALDKCR